MLTTDRGTDTSAAVPWTERRFSFDFPAGCYREILERLRGTPARLEDRLAPLDARAIIERVDGRWSIQEHAGHLGDLEALFHGRLDDYQRGVSVLRAADMSNRLTWDAAHNTRRLADVLAGFRAARAELVARLEALPPERFAQVARHPRLDAPMRIVDMMYFHAEHDDYHLARISELIGAAP